MEYITKQKCVNAAKITEIGRTDHSITDPDFWVCTDDNKTHPVRRELLEACLADGSRIAPGAYYYVVYENGTDAIIPSPQFKADYAPRVEGESVVEILRPYTILTADNDIDAAKIVAMKFDEIAKAYDEEMCLRRNLSRRLDAALSDQSGLEQAIRLADELRAKHNGVMAVNLYLGHDGDNACTFSDSHQIVGHGCSGRSLLEAVQRAESDWRFRKMLDPRSSWGEEVVGIAFNRAVADFGGYGSGGAFFETQAFASHLQTQEPTVTHEQVAELLEQHPRTVKLAGLRGMKTASTAWLLLPEGAKKAIEAAERDPSPATPLWDSLTDEQRSAAKRMGIDDDNREHFAANFIAARADYESRETQPDPRDPHVTVPVLVWVDVDEGIAEHVKYLNTIEGVRTHASCQGTINEGGPHPYRAQIMVTWDTDTAEARLFDEFDVTLLGDRFAYVHPKKLDFDGGKYGRAGTMVFSSSGSSEVDEDFARNLSSRNKKLAEGLCPNGHGPMLESDGAQECPKCNFRYERHTLHVGE